MTTQFIIENKNLVRSALTNWLKKATTQPLYGSSIFGGGDVRELEELFCEIFHSKYAISMSSCTAAIHSAIVSSNVKKGGKILLVNSKWDGIDGVVKFSGAKPVRSNNEEKNLLQQFQSSNRRNLKAIVITRSIGDDKLMLELKSICEDTGMILIEDFADLKELDLNKTIAPGYGHFAVFSFGYDKWIQAGEGGMLLCNNFDYYTRALQFSQHPICQKARLLAKMKNPVKYGLNYRIHPLAASLALLQLKFKSSTMKRKK